MSMQGKILGLAIVFILCTSLVLPISVLAQYSDYYYKYFEWSYGGIDYYWNLTIPKALYEEYKDVSIFSRVSGGIGGYGFLTTTEDLYVENMATQLNESASEKGYNPFETF